MGRRDTGREERTLTEVDRLKASDVRDRRQRIARLRRELRRVREIAKRLEQELRLLSGPASSAGVGTDWNQVFDRLGATFTAREMARMTDARAGLIASIVYRWRAQGRIVSVRRGTFRKARGRH